MPFTANLSAGDLFGFDTVQQISLRKIFDLVEQASATGAAAYNVSNTEFFGFETEQQEALRDSLTWIYFFKVAPPGLLTSNCFNLAQRNSLQNVFLRFAQLVATTDLRAFVTANYNQPNPFNQPVMASPPTIAVSLSNDAALTTVNVIDGPAKLDKVRVLGGAPLWNGALMGVKAATVTSGGNIVANAQQNAAAWEVQTNSLVVEFRVFPQNTTRARIFVSENGGPFLKIAASPTTLASSTAISYIKLTFGSAINRVIRVEAARQDGDASFSAMLLSRIALPPGSDCTATLNSRPIFAYYGDSITEGAIAGYHAEGYANLASWKLGVECTQSAIGGTGYVLTGGNPNATQRLDDLLLQPYRAVVVAMGINDIGQPDATISANVATTLNGIRSRLPYARIFVVGPWDASAPGAPGGGYTACKNAIIAGIPANVGATFLDPQGVSYTKGDAIHPDGPGHVTLGDWLALQIKTALGA